MNSLETTSEFFGQEQKNIGNLSKNNNERKRIKHPERYLEYKLLIDKGMNPTQIALELGVTKQAASEYIAKHFDHSVCSFRKGRKPDERKCERIREMTKQRLVTQEIARRLGYPNVRGLLSYLKIHPELPRPISHNQRVYERISGLIEKGLNQTEMARVMEYSQPACISSYFEDHPELKEKYWRIQRRKK